MNPLRSRLAILLYLTTIVLWSFAVDENRDLKQLFKEKSEAIKQYDSLLSTHEYLMLKHDVVLDYADGFGHNINWDTATELKNKQQ